MSQPIHHGRSPPTPETHNISNRENVRAWHINAETCLAFWVANGTDCATYIRVYPFNKPWGIHHEFVRWIIRTQPRFNKLLLWADTALGYGKKKASAAFWGDPDLTPPISPRNNPTRNPDRIHPIASLLIDSFQGKCHFPSQGRVSIRATNFNVTSDTPEKATLEKGEKMKKALVGSK